MRFSAHAAGSSAIDFGLAAEAAAKIRRCFAMAWQAECAEIVEIALTAAFRDGKNVVGVPERAAGGHGLHAPEGEGVGTGFAAAALELGVGRDGVRAAGGADSAVAGEDQVAEVAGIGSETPLVDAVIRTEGAAAAREDFKLAPAAERQAVGAKRQGVRVGATGFGERSLRQSGHKAQE